MKVAIQGIEGSFHHIAAEQYFGKDIQLVGCLSFEEACLAIVENDAEYAVMAIENTTVGSFLPNYILLKEYNLFIVGEAYLQIRHNLIALPGQTLDDIKSIRSQEIAFGQCREFFKEHTHLLKEDVSDTAAAAREIRDRNLKGVAAIASYRAAKMYGLDIIKEKVESNQNNYTRFWILSKKKVGLKKEHNKATLSLRVGHNPGFLVTALNAFKVYGVNLTKIQSVPMVDLPYEYLIYVDCVWNDEDDFKRMILLLKEKTLLITSYGTYKEGKKNTFATEERLVAKSKKAKQLEATPVIIDKISVQDLREWVPIKPKAPENYVIFSGPCSAETEEQTIDTLRQLQALDMISIFRAGVWKPRTRAGGFEGNGEIALKWLQKFKEETDALVMVEVASSSHVKLCLDYGIDALWIGARTSANPFSVQEIADAVRGIDIPVFVKNPVNPDFELWIGAVERIAHAGIKKLAVIHRGFSIQEKTKYRNYPAWSLLGKFKERLPNIPIINDPSHISGRREFLAEISQKAIDLGVDGFIIESHRDPENAWTDAAQQLTPKNLEQMLTSLVWRSPLNQSKEYTAMLDDLRTTIDRLDIDLISMLASRMQAAKEIGMRKKENGIEISQPNRWDSILKDRLEFAKKHGLRESFVREVLNRIQEESIGVQVNLKK